MLQRWEGSNNVPTLTIGEPLGGAGTSLPTDHVRFELGVKGWQSRHVGINIAYSMSWTRSNSYVLVPDTPSQPLVMAETTLVHVVTLTFTARVK